MVKQTTDNIEGGFLSTLLTVYGMVPTMKDYSKSGKKVLRQVGNYKVVDIAICRKPIQEFVNKTLNATTLGSWQRAVRKYGYDKLFHLYIIVWVIDSNRKKIPILIEKNEIINIAYATDKDIQGNESEIQYVEMKPEFYVLNDMLQKTKDSMGSGKYWSYNAFKNNCQTFVKYFLDSNNLLTPQLLDFIDQKAEQISEDSVSAPVKFGVNVITTLASKLRRIQNLI